MVENQSFRDKPSHAVKLEFTHPFTKERISCHAPFLDEQEIFPI